MYTYSGFEVIIVRAHVSEHADSAMVKVLGDEHIHYNIPHRKNPLS